MITWYQLDKNKMPVPVKNWDEMRMMDPEDRTVAQDRVPCIFSNGRVGTAFVSTVFLQLDHAFDGGAPVLWETMIFPDGEWDQEYQDRYRSHEMAEIGHREALRWIHVQILRQWWRWLPVSLLFIGGVIKLSQWRG